MSKNQESKLYPKIEKWIRDSYPNAWILRTTEKFRAGIPDFLICADGKFIGIEVKTNDGVLRGIQSYELTKISEAGGKSFVIFGEVPSKTFQEVINENHSGTVQIGRSGERAD